MAEKTFASFLKELCKEHGAGETPVEFHRWMIRAGIDVSRQSCGLWFSGTLKPGRKYVGLMADAFELEGAERLAFYDAACAP